MVLNHEGGVTKLPLATHSNEGIHFGATRGRGVVRQYRHPNQFGPALESSSRLVDGAGIDKVKRRRPHLADRVTLGYGFASPTFDRDGGYKCGGSLRPASVERHSMRTRHDVEGIQKWAFFHD
jgi:hypothetical protein